MKEQKNIDRLFQEKFKDFEVAPPEMAWENIEAKLNKKEKKRRVIPFWFKPTGIAASLLVGFYTFMYLNEHATIDSEKNKNSIEFKKNSSKKTQGNELLIVPNNSTVTDNGNLDNTENKESKSYFEQTTSIRRKESINSNAKTINPKNNIIVTNNKLNNGLNNLLQNENLEEKSGIKDVLSNNINSNHLEVESQLSNSTLAKSEKKSEIDNPLDQIKDNSNRSVVILEKLNDNITQDSSIVAKISEEVSTLEQLLKEKEVGKNVEEKEKGNKWGVSTRVAPVYFNSTTNGSPIDTQFTENSKSYVSTLSYGASINYDISKRISLRAGVNSLALEYNTNDVLYTSTLKNATQSEATLSRNTNGQNIIFVNQNAENSISADVANFVEENKGTLNQTTRYIEIPLELGYKLIDRKFGVELIGGMSSLFLNDNSISLLSNGMEMEIGKANNLNKVHFSSNIGIGFKYTFLKSFEANFNPMFKYQLNTYKDNSGNFKPYFIGLYSGLTFKF